MVELILEMAIGGVRMELSSDLFAGMQNLTRIKLYKIGLIDMPQDILRDAKNLKHLEIDGNHLTALPDLSKNTKLETLTCSRNNINFM